MIIGRCSIQIIVLKKNNSRFFIRLTVVGYRPTGGRRARIVKKKTIIDHRNGTMWKTNNFRYFFSPTASFDIFKHRRSGESVVSGEFVLTPDVSASSNRPEDF